MYIETQPRVEQILTTVNCTVKFDFLDEAVIIPVVNPTDENDFITAFKNREITEKRKLDETI